MEQGMLTTLKQGMDKLQLLPYSEICINGMLWRILGIQFMEVPPDWTVKRHKHSFFEFHYILSGHACTILNGAAQCCESGQFYLMPPGTYHAHISDGREGHIGFALRWELVEWKAGTLPASVSRDAEELSFILDKAHSGTIEDTGFILERVQRLCKDALQGCTRMEMQLQFLGLVFGIASCYAYEAKPAEPSAELCRNEVHLVDNALRFMEENFSEEMDVRDIAAAVHISYSHLARVFRKHTGETLGQRLTRIRLAQAHRLLVCTGSSIAAIARDVGFQSEHYFCTLFKQAYGTTPGSCRAVRGPLPE